MITEEKFNYNIMVATIIISLITPIINYATALIEWHIANTKNVVINR